MNATADAAPAWTAHSGTPVAAIRGAYIDEAGQLLLDTDLGIGLVHDADLDRLLPRFSAGGLAGEAALDATLDALQAGNSAGLLLDTGAAGIPVNPVRAAEVPSRFGFVARPRQPEGQEECY